MSIPDLGNTPPDMSKAKHMVCEKCQNKTFKQTLLLKNCQHYFHQLDMKQLFQQQCSLVKSVDMLIKSFLIWI